MTSPDPRCVSPSELDLKYYRLLQQGCGFVDLSDCTQLELHGGDRQRFLHNLCTNDIQKLQVGQGCEAFATTVQGKCLGHILVFCGVQSLVVTTVPGQAEVLLPHWDRYLITEDVQLSDHSQDWGQLLMAGNQASRLLHAMTAQWNLDQDCAHQSFMLDHMVVWARRTPMTAAPTYLLACLRPHLPDLMARLVSAGATQCSLAALHMARVEHGFPWFGWDISDKNLPQEVNRNQRAISFQKGCYLGQETIARIDALGHVNRLLVGVRCESTDVPQVDAPILIDGQNVGHVTSAAYSPRADAGLALAYVRSQHSRPGTRVELPAGPAQIVELHA
jgi:folate-binding protein YgfZ